MIREVPRSTLLGLPRIFFAGGIWRHVNNFPTAGPYMLGYLTQRERIDLNIKAGKYCNEMNRVGRDNLQP